MDFLKLKKIVRYSNTLQIAIQNAYIDLCEIAARSARKYLTELVDSTKSTGMLTLVFADTKADMEKYKDNLFNDFIKDVIIDKKEGAFLEWRKKIEEYLSQTEKWATKEEDYDRFILCKPLLKGYILAPTLYKFKK